MGWLVEHYAFALEAYDEFVLGDAARVPFRLCVGGGKIEDRPNRVIIALGFAPDIRLSWTVAIIPIWPALHEAALLSEDRRCAPDTSMKADNRAIKRRRGSQGHRVWGGPKIDVVQSELAGGSCPCRKLLG